MKIITLAQQKGGVGKTTVCVNLACQARKRKKRAVILDMDVEQASAFFWGEKRKTVALAPQIPVYRVRSPELQTRLDALNKEGVEWVFIDLPGRDVPSTGLNVANLTLLPTRPVEDDVRPSLVTAGLLRRADRRYAYLMNIAPAQADKARARKVAAVLRDAGHTVADPIITERIGISDANARGMGINEREPNSESAREYSELFKWIEGQLK